MADRLKGKVAVVTGGGGGIGEATARLFWEEGAAVAILDNDMAAAQTAAKGIDASGERVLALAADLTKEPEAERAIKETVARFGKVDVLAIKAGGGSIINVSSANAIVGRQKWSQYDASKAALLAMTRDMACDHAEQNIRVNSICPGPTLTPFHIRNRSKRENISYEQAEALMREAGVRNLMKRHGEPRELAYSILFLACDESSYVTGANFMIDGGLSAV
jgi:NAD(P)-dependent dehydrogenase (short-subunit alcohol dehydrogenase family)